MTRIICNPMELSYRGQTSLLRSGWGVAPGEPSRNVHHEGADPSLMLYDEVSAGTFPFWDPSVFQDVDGCVPVLGCDNVLQAPALAPPSRTGTATGRMRLRCASASTGVFERRRGLFPAGFDAEGALTCNQNFFADCP